ncbi:MAG: AIR synthase related protein [Desulfuromonadales bacterium]
MAENTILLDHGSGGLASQELISGLFLKHLDSPILKGLEDSAVIDNQPGRLVFTTDSYVVDPIFFPGGDIGKLAVHGTINDLAMRGGRPLCLSLALILEEGLALDELEKIIISIAEAAAESGDGGRIVVALLEKRQSRRRGYSVGHHGRSRHHHHDPARRHCP